MTVPPAHVADELPGFLAGECDRSQTLAIAAHLRSCALCRDELVSVAVAAGTLRAAARAERNRPGPAWPGPTLPEGHEPGGPANGPANGDGSEPASGDPDPPAWLTHPSRRLPRAPSGRRRFAAIAAAVVVLAGGIAAAVGLSASGSSVVGRATLHPLDAPAGASGAITVTASSGSRLMVVRTRGLPAPGGQHFYEVWLLDPVTLKMLPMGALPPSGQASYGVAASLMAGYSAVDISLQADNGNPAHSAISVLRGSLLTGTALP
jgi:Anti-sigma-K factor rskA